MRLSLRRLGVMLHARKIDHDARLVADNPAVVTWRNSDHIAGTELKLGPVRRMFAVNA